MRPFDQFVSLREDPGSKRTNPEIRTTRNSNEQPFTFHPFFSLPLCPFSIQLPLDQSHPVHRRDLFDQRIDETIRVSFRYPSLKLLSNLNKSELSLPGMIREVELTSAWNSVTGSSFVIAFRLDFNCKKRDRKIEGLLNFC